MAKFCLFGSADNFRCCWARNEVRAMRNLCQQIRQCLLHSMGSAGSLGTVRLPKAPTSIDERGPTTSGSRGSTAVCYSAGGFNRQLYRARVLSLHWSCWTWCPVAVVTFLEIGHFVFSKKDFKRLLQPRLLWASQPEVITTTLLYHFPDPAV